MAEADPHRELERVRALQAQADETVAQLEKRLLAAERAAGRVAQLELELRAAHADADVLRTENEELRRVNRELEATAAHFREVNDGLMQSLSWRVTKPLRAAKGAREG